MTAIVAADLHGRPVAGARVVVTAGAVTVEAVSDRRGLAEVDLPAGIDIVELRIEATDTTRLIGRSGVPELGGTRTIPVAMLAQLGQDRRVRAGQALQEARDLLEQLGPAVDAMESDPVQSALTIVAGILSDLVDAVG